MMRDRAELFAAGSRVMGQFCELNKLPEPKVWAYEDAAKWPFGVCAYYRWTSGIKICVPKCASVGTAGRQWSFPGYTVDRTPYGVVQHELGHHVDVHMGKSKGHYWSEFSAAVRGESGEKEITSYCPNDAEWFAEMFRVYVTNPDLLLQVRPRTHREIKRNFEPLFRDTWRERLAGAPARTIAAAERQVERAAA